MNKKYSDQNAIRDAVELFLVNHFNSIDIAGAVKFSGENGVNYFGIDLTEYKWDKNVEALHVELSKYLTEWSNVNIRNFRFYIEIANITIEYFLPEVDNTLMNVSKNIQLFYLPSHYYRTTGNKRVARNRNAVWFLKQWNDYLIRNTIITGVLTGILVYYTLVFYNKNSGKMNDIGKLFEYTNLASSIMASFLLTFLITKVIALKQQKMSKVPEIKELSTKLTYFRKVCLNFRKDFNYWNKDNPYFKSYNHGVSIVNKITFEEYFYPDHMNDEKYAHFKGLFRDDVSHPIIHLILQLYMFSDDDYSHNSDLTYTQYPRNYIYTLKELDRFSIFMDNNSIWYACDNQYFPEVFPKTYQSIEIMKDIERISEEFNGKPLTRSVLNKVSLDFQYDIIPRLYRLVKLAEKRLPESIIYFLTITSSILLLGIVVPSVLYIFLGATIWSVFSSCVVLGLILHVLLSLPFLFKEENQLNRVIDYI